MDNKITNLETIVENGLCVGCGLCESVVGRDLVQMGLTSASRMRPQLKGSLSDASFEKIKEICPGISLNGPDVSQTEDQGIFDDLWGPIRTLHRGWSANEDIRFRSAAGGIMTALGCYLLETGAVDAVVHVRASTQHPMETDAIVSRTVEEVRAGSQSRYGPAAPLVNVMALLDQGERFAVLAKPCDIAAIRKLGEVDSRVDKQIPYLITLFCGGVPKIDLAKDIAEYHDVKPEEISVFRWRGNGWPGPTHIETHDGRVFDLPYGFVYFDETAPWKYDMQFRCKICPDAIGESADVACPDSWEMKDGKPLHDEAPGANLLIARTQKGEELVKAAAAAGAIHIDPFTLDQLDEQHDDHKARKIENPARVKALGLEGFPAPDFKNFRSEAMANRMTAEEYEAALEGTRDRIRRDFHKEPLI